MTGAPVAAEPVRMDPPADRRPSAVRGIAAILCRDARERKFLRLAFLLDLVFGAVNLVVFLFISRALHHPGLASPGATVRYFDFVAVGIVFSLVVQAAVTQLAARVRDQQRAGTLELLAAQPVGAGTVALGTAAYPFLLAMVRAGVYLALCAGLLGMRVAGADWLGVALVLVTGGMATMGLGIGLAAFAVAVGAGEPAARVLVVALAFLSGTYFPTAALPAPVRWLSLPLPTRLALDGIRSALTGGPWAGEVAGLAAAAAATLPAALWLFGLALARATRRGGLSRD